MPDSVLAYDWLAPRRVVFGWGRRAEIGALTASISRRAWVVLGSRTLRDNGTWDALAASLDQAGVAATLCATISREPQVADVDPLVDQLRQEQATADDVMIAIGGGSAIDLAKAAAALVTQPFAGSVQDYLEGVGRGWQLTAPGVPLIAVPTTGGTGTEATKNAVISSLDPPFKKSIRADSMLPQAVLIDPELSVSVPPQTTAFTGMDAITQLIESYVCRKATPVTRMLCVEGLRAALPRVVEAVQDGCSRRAREAMSHAAFLSGMALANSGLGLAHGVAAGLGVLAQVPHGQACAVMLPVALRVNFETVQPQLAQLARETLGVDDKDDASAARRFVETIVGLCRELQIPTRLADLGLKREQLTALVPASRGNSMNGNPRQLNDSELLTLLEEIW